jgi:hypothetical protein
LWSAPIVARSKAALHWAPDGQRLACESFGLTDPNRTGVYTIRSPDGGGLTQITSIPSTP